MQQKTKEFFTDLLAIFIVIIVLLGIGVALALLTDVVNSTTYRCKLVAPESQLADIQEKYRIHFVGSATT